MDFNINYLPVLVDGMITLEFDEEKQNVKYLEVDKLENYFKEIIKKLILFN